jgi:hypothetical protein
MNTTATPTKTEELAALQALASQLGPHSYLGPWLRDALPWLADQLRSDLAPQQAQAMVEEAARLRADACTDAIAIRQRAHNEARAITDQATSWADKRTEEVSRITGRAWEALRLAQKELEQ